MRQERIEIAWRAPLAAAAPLAEEAGCLVLLSAGEHPLSRWSYVLARPRATWTWREGDGGDPFGPARARPPASPPDRDAPPFSGGWAGLLSYELGRAFERLPWPGGERDGWPDVALARYDTLAAFDHHARRAWVLSRSGGARAFAAALGAGGEAAPAPQADGPGLAAEESEPALAATVARARAYVRAGDIFQANVSTRFSGRLAAGDSPYAWFARAVAASPGPFAAYLRLADRAVVSVSPERFLTLAPDGALETRPIKGTRPRGATQAEDEAFAAALAASAKDRAENLMIVDLMRNDLARVSPPGSVKVPALFALERFSTVHHLVSTVTARLRPGLTAWDALAAAFPPGSVTGAPKVRAMEVIAELEGAPRGPYCGAIVWAGDDGAMDSSVLIRTAACVRDAAGWRVSVRAGAGVVADSEPEAEVAEMLTKAMALRRSAGGAPARWAAE